MDKEKANELRKLLDANPEEALVAVEASRVLGPWNGFGRRFSLASHMIAAIHDEGSGVFATVGSRRQPRKEKDETLRSFKLRIETMLIADGWILVEPMVEPFVESKEA